MKQLQVEIKGIVPLLMHSDRYSNPLDELTKAHKVLTKKRAKTEDDQEQIIVSEFLGSLYYDKQLGVYIPGSNLESCIFEGARKYKLGKVAKAGVIISQERNKLSYSGPSKAEDLAQSAAHRDVRGVVISRARIMRCRPRFDDWSVKFTVLFNESLLDRQQIIDSLVTAGEQVGLCDFRPRYGRFELVSAV